MIVRFVRVLLRVSFFFFPWLSADWPYSWRTIQSSMSGLDPHDRQLILAGNAQRLYHFG